MQKLGFMFPYSVPGQNYNLTLILFSNLFIFPIFIVILVKNFGLHKYEVEKRNKTITALPKICRYSF